MGTSKNSFCAASGSFSALPVSQNKGNGHFPWSGLLACAVLLCFSAAARADTIFFTDGAEIEGKILRVTAHTVVVRLPNGRTCVYQKRNVEMIVYERDDEEKEAAGKTTEPGRAGTTAKKEAAVGAQPDQTKKAAPPAGEGGGSGGEAAAGKKTEGGKNTAEDEKPPPLAAFPKGEKRLEEKDERRLLELMRRLADSDATVRAKASAGIYAFGKDAVPYLAAGLYDGNVRARSTCAKLLGKLGARKAIKQLIEVLYAALPETDRPATYQVPFIRALKPTLARVTGRRFISVQPSSVLVQEGLKKYIAWYNENIDGLPRQLGEPELDRTAADYVEQLHKARALKLEKHAWPRPPTVAELGAGEKELPKGAGERKADKDFARSLPKVDRESGGGMFREKDRQKLKNFYR